MMLMCSSGSLLSRVTLVAVSRFVTYIAYWWSECSAFRRCVLYVYQVCPYFFLKILLFLARSPTWYLFCKALALRRQGDTWRFMLLLIGGVRLWLFLKHGTMHGTMPIPRINISQPMNEPTLQLTTNQRPNQSTPTKKRQPAFWLVHIGGPRAGDNPRLPVISAVELRVRGGLHLEAYRQAGTGTFAPTNTYILEL